MEGIEDEEINSLLSSFDEFYEDFKNFRNEVDVLKFKCSSEMKNREAFQSMSDSLKLENEQLKKIFEESLKNLADQLEYRSICQSLRGQLKSAKEEYLHEIIEQKQLVDSLQRELLVKDEDLDNQKRAFLLHKGVAEETISRLQHDLASQSSHIDILANRLKQIGFDMESQYCHEIQDLKDCLLIEQEEKKELKNRLLKLERECCHENQDLKDCLVVEHEEQKDLKNKLLELERELVLTKGKMAEEQHGLTSTQNVETLKHNMMKLRRENAILKMHIPR